MIEHGSKERASKNKKGRNSGVNNQRKRSGQSVFEGQVANVKSIVLFPFRSVHGSQQTCTWERNWS